MTNRCLRKSWSSTLRRIRRQAGAGLVPLILGVALGAVACDDDALDPGDGVDNTDSVATAEFSFTVPVGSQTRVRVEAINGNVTVTGVSQAGSFVVRGERRVGSESVRDAAAHLDELQVEVIDMGDELVVQTVQPENTGGRTYVVNYEITVPRDIELDIGDFNGNIDVDDISDDVAVGTVNGNVTLGQIEGNTAAATVNGNVTAEVTIPSGGTIKMATVNGNISLSIPDDTSAELLAQVTNGSISTSGLVLQNQVVTGTSLRGTLGAGDGQITLGTVNGSITATGF